MLFLTGAGGAPTSYQINRSLRFNDDDSAHLTRTPAGASNRDLWTLSIWFKRSNLGGDQSLVSVGADNNNHTTIRISNAAGSRTDQIDWATVSGGSVVQRLTTSQVFRDPSGWYHLVCLYDSANATADDRQRIFLNGTQVTSFSTRTNPTSGQDLFVNNNTQHSIGRYQPGASEFFDGYMAEIHFVDGTALTPSSFGETDAVTGVWKPKRASGITYGTNGFYLSFNDNTSTTTLGYDDAGSNDWTLNNFSVTAGVGNDSLNDTPTNNYPVLHILDGGSGSLANGNLQWAMNASSGRRASFGMSTGKWYWECVVTAGTNPAYAAHGIQPAGGALTGYGGTTQIPSGYGYFGFDGNKLTGTTGAAYGNTFTTNDIISVAFDAGAGKIWFAKNGTWQASGDPAAGTNEAYSSIPAGTYFPYVSNQTTSNNDHQGYINFGQRPFAYTPPTGFSALCTRNLPTPTIVRPSQHFNAVTYTGTGSSLAITGVGHQPDLVWIKGRSGATDHALYDAVRGAQARLESNTTDAEATTDAGLTAFGSDGFTVNTLAQVNTSTATYVGWCWKEGVTPGFDIVTYTGNGSNRTIAHSLGAAPHFMIIKRRSAADSWVVYHSQIGAANNLILNSTAAQQANGNIYFNTTAPTSSVFSLGTDSAVNANTATYVAYLFTEIAGFSRFGSYTGNGSTDGPFVWCGFRPKFVMVKSTGASAWFTWDAVRNAFNASTTPLFPSSSGAEEVTLYPMDILSNGFKLRGAAGLGINESATYIFAAFAETPFKTALAR